MSEHKRGSMDITRHERDFVGFIKITTWVCALAIAAIIFLAVFNS